MAVRVRLYFAKPGFFLADTAVEVWLDDRLAYRGGFQAGFEVWATIEPGPHQVRAAIAVGPWHRRRQWPLVVPEVADGAQHFAVGLRYSRIWGNFKARLDTQLAPG